MSRLPPKRFLLLFYGFDILLLFVIVLLFLPLSKRNIPDTIRLRFIENPDEIKIIEILLPEKETLILMEKNGDVWMGTDTDSNRKLNWPCDFQTVNRFLSEAAREMTLEKKAEKVSAWKNLGVDERSSCRISFYGKDGSRLSSYWFGKVDSLSGKIAIRTDADQTVWATETSLSDFVFNGTSFWADPFIEPFCVAGEGDKAGKLRRGKLEYISPSENIKPVNIVSRMFSNGNRAIYTIYEKDGSYIVLPSFFMGTESENETAIAIESINYRYSISQWTYERFLEEVKNE